jgi:hypothetical protein
VIAWISKYALTKGVFSLEVIHIPEYPSMVQDATHSDVFFHGNDWHLTREEALDQAEKRRVKKIASLRSQLSKLEQMCYE